MTALCVLPIILIGNYIALEYHPRRFRQAQMNYNEINVTLFRIQTPHPQEREATETHKEIPHKEVRTSFGKTKTRNQSTREERATETPPELSYKELIALVAKDKAIMLAMVDGGYMDMVINLFISGIKPYNISNFIILAIDNVTCPELRRHGIHCAMYMNFELSTEASKYSSKEFNAKMSARSQILLDVLTEGYTVLHVDTDLYFYSNPFDDIICPPKSCHMAALFDEHSYNAGFILLHPNQYSLELYNGMVDLQQKEPGLTEQKRLNAIIAQMQRRSSKEFNIIKLSQRKYQCGKEFYSQRVFADTAALCPECIVVHNNWIIGIENKVLRAKEMHQWMYDKDTYYTSTTNKYLAYENPTPKDEKTSAQVQIARLTRALSLGYILERIVILPTFYIKNNAKSLFSLIGIKSFDAQFDGAYREHSFLTHPLVPDSIKASTIVLVMLDMNGPAVTEGWIREHLQEQNASVLSFGPLEHDIIFTNETLAAKIKRRFLDGLH